MKRHVLCLSVIMFATEVAAGATISVRKDGAGDYAVIQEALDVAAAGDTILIGPGQYVENSSVRLPGWSWDIVSYSHVAVDDLTIIGAGADKTLIGPTTYSGNTSLASPAGLTYAGDGRIEISNICITNCFNGAYVEGILFADHCVMTNNSTGILWLATGVGGWIKESLFDAANPSWPTSIDVINGGGAGSILVENCSFEHSLTLIEGVDGVTIRGCEFANHVGAVQIYSSAYVFVEDCRMTNIGVVGIDLTMGQDGVCEVRNSQVAGDRRALMQQQVGGRFIVENTRLEGGTYSILYAAGGSGVCSIQNSDLIKGGGPAIECGTGGLSVVHDLTNNYWGTTSAADIQAWIIDSNDDPNIAATVLYSPFAGQSVPTETTTWGDLKALFR